MGKCIHQTVVLSLSASLAALLLLSSCGVSSPTENAYLQDTDYAYMYDGAPMAESPNGYYYRTSDFVYYIDKQTMTAVPLCDKPDCLHEKETDPEKVTDCNACLLRAYGDPLIAYYEGKLYVAAAQVNANLMNEGEVSNVLVRMNSDGSERETVLQFPHTATHYLIHRGYLYYTDATYSETESGELGSVYGVYRVPLKGGKTETVYENNLPNGVLDRMTAYGNYVYYEHRPNTDGVYSIEYYWFDIHTGEQGKLFSPPELVDPMQPRFLNGKIYSVFYHNQDLENPEAHYFEYITCGLTGEELAPFDLFSTSPYYAMRPDETSFWYYAIPWRDEPRLLQQYSADGTLLAQWEGADYSFNATMIPGSQEHFFYSDLVENETGDTDFVLYALEKNPPDGVMQVQECLRISYEDYTKRIVVQY